MLPVNESWSVGTISLCACHMPSLIFDLSNILIFQPDIHFFLLQLKEKNIWRKNRKERNTLRLSGNLTLMKTSTDYNYNCNF